MTAHLRNNHPRPSPYGDFVFQRIWENDDVPYAYDGFRPLTGILFFNENDKEYIGTENITGFRPLTGILFFNPREGRKERKIIMKIVSVPLRGFCFSTFFRNSILVNSLNVSVPLRGFCFSTENESRHYFRLRLWFPSPYGDFVFQRENIMKEKDYGKLFPSPYGDFVFQPKFMKITNGLYAVSSFRPLTGILFFNTRKSIC